MAATQAVSDPRADLPELDLQEIPSTLREQARHALLVERDAIGFLAYAENTRALQLVVDNQPLLVELGDGIYEACLLHALTATRTNNSGWPVWFLVRLLKAADPLALWFAGDDWDCPDDDRLTLYRGVAGVGTKRRERGIHWTLSPAVAAFFALRFKATLANPAVVCCTIDQAKVLAYSNGRQEQEVLILPPNSVTVVAAGVDQLEVLKGENNDDD